MWANFTKNNCTFYPKNCHQALKNIGLGSEIRKKPIPDPRFKKAPDPQHCCSAINPNTAGNIEKKTHYEDKEWAVVYVRIVFYSQTVIAR